MDELYNRIESLGKLRGYKNMTVLCKAAGVSRSAMSELNAGRSKDISKPNAQKFANLLGLTLDDIYGTEQKESPFAIANEGSTKAQQKLKVLARHLDKIPEEKRERLIRNFEESIDVYLDAMGIPKEGE